MKYKELEKENLMLKSKIDQLEKYNSFLKSYIEDPVKNIQSLIDYLERLSQSQKDFYMIGCMEHKKDYELYNLPEENIRYMQKRNIANAISEAIVNKSIIEIGETLNCNLLIVDLIEYRRKKAVLEKAKERLEELKYNEQI